MAVWGQSPTSPNGGRPFRAEVIGAGRGPAWKTHSSVRSIPAVTGEPSLGLLIDESRRAFRQPASPSDHRSTSSPLIHWMTPALTGTRRSRARHRVSARGASERNTRGHRSGRLLVPEPGYVLVIDQTEGRCQRVPRPAAERQYQVSRDALTAARDENPGAPHHDQNPP